LTKLAGGSILSEPARVGALGIELAGNGHRMNEKNRARLMELVTPMLRQGERVELACTPNVGSVSIKRQVATAAIVGLVTLGHLAVAVRPKTRYVVLTDQRLLFLDMELSGRPSLPLVAELPRHELTSSRFKSALKATFLISIEGDPKSLKMEFPFPGRHDARQLADALAR
jgi:hypothetical protein